MSSLTFNDSATNQLFTIYLNSVLKIQSKLDSLQVKFFNSSDKFEQENITSAYKNYYNQLNDIQTKSEEATKGEFVYHYIKASARFNNKTPIRNPVEYLSSIKSHFFDNIDLIVRLC